MKVGKRDGVCRDFAVLGYCSKGLDCEHQHVRECPDFAEQGTCQKKGCRLPHVIRANRRRVVNADETKGKTKSPAVEIVSSGESVSGTAADASEKDAVHAPTAEDAQLGDEYISLTFMESDEDESEDEDDDDGEDEEGEHEEGDEEHVGELHPEEDMDDVLDVHI